MDKDKKKEVGPVNRLQILLGAFFLLIGALVYLIDRPPGHTYFLIHLKFITSFHKTLPGILGTAGNCLPDFIHPFSFILITAGIIASGKRGYFFICLFWLVIDCAFELGQKYSTLVINAVPDRFSGIPFLEAFENYFRNGTFDPYDIAAIFAGTLTAYFVLILTRKS